MAVEEVITAQGHEHVAATHRSTLEVTTDDWLTPAGDCIVAVAADAAPSSFDPTVVESCRDASARIELEIATADHTGTLVGRGDPSLTFASDRSAVCRTSTHVDDRTVMLEASGAARDLDRALVADLAGGAPVTVTLRVS